MSLQSMIYKLRRDAKMSQAEFAELFGVSSQAVQKWESGASQPSLENVVTIAKRFGISVDALVLERDERTKEELPMNKKLQPRYANLHDWELYSGELLVEYRQCTEEGLDIAEYEDLFAAVAKMPRGERKERMADVLFEVVLNAKMREGYAFNEPSDLESIRSLRKPYSFAQTPPCEKRLKEKLHGAWMGRICGCLLGKPVECARTDELIPFLKESGNYPMHRYLLKEDITEETKTKYKFNFRADLCADANVGMPADDDTNYTVMAQEMIDYYGQDFTSYDVSRTWLAKQGKDSYCTAERVAFCNFVKGFEPPESAMYKNPYREWIGAQIRGDYYGYINPGDPERAAEMAYRDACISHVKNGIYGEMFVAAMLACAAVTENITDIIRGGLAEIPSTSRLYKAVNEVLEDFESGVTGVQCLKKIHTRFDEHDGHDWCHTIPNALIVVAGLLYGKDFGTAVCMTVETGFDTDCNGATVGSILGMRGGIGCIDDKWKIPVGDVLHTTILGVGSTSISERAERTYEHIRNRK